MKKKVPNSNRKIDTLTDNTFSWLSTGTLIKSDGVMLGFMSSIPHCCGSGVVTQVLSTCKDNVNLHVKTRYAGLLQRTL